MINGQRYPSNSVYIAILGAIYDSELTLPAFHTSTIDITPEQFKQYEGIYASEDFPLKIKIFQECGTFYGQADGQSAFPLTCYEKDRFMFEGAQVYMHFSPSRDSMFFEQDGVELNFKRQKPDIHNGVENH